MKEIIAVIFALLFQGVLFSQQPVDYILKSKALIEYGKCEEAVVFLSAAIEKFSDFRLFILRAEAFTEKENYTEALKDFNSASSLSSGSGEYGIARIYALKRDAATALMHLDLNLSSSFKKSEKEVMLDPAFELIENKPEWRLFWKKERYDHVETCLSEIEYYLSAGKKEEAYSAMNDLNSNYPGNNNALYAKALVFQSAGRSAEAIGILTKLIDSDKENESWLMLMGAARRSTGNYAGAVSTYSTLINLGVADASLFMKRADSYRKSGETDKALADILKFLEFYPENRDAISLAGKVEAEAGDNLKAIDYFSNNLKLHPNDPGCYIDRADSYFVSKNWDSAIKDYTMALDLQPDNSETWLNKGIALINKGKEDDACHDLRKALSLGNKRAASYISKNCIK